MKSILFRISFCFLLLFCLNTTATAQQGILIHQDDYYVIQYPQSWKKSGFTNYLNIEIPRSSSLNSYVQIRTTYGNMYSPPIIEAMSGDLEMLQYPQGEKFISAIKTTAITLDNKSGYLIDRSNDKDKDLEYSLAFDDMTVVKIRIKTDKATYQRLQETLNDVVNSIRFKEKKSDKKQKIIETTRKEFTEDWVTQKVKVSGTSSNLEMTKLDSILQFFMYSNFSIKLTDTEVEIKNWADFFEFKADSPLKDYQIFSYQNWTGRALQIFRMHMHLGEYDNLLISENGENSLNFLFLKDNGHTIRLEMDYEETHNFPLDINIPLERFLYTTTQGFRRKKDGKAGSDVPFLINDKVYRLKVANLSVF